MTLQELLDPVAAIARKAGAAILDVYRSADHGVQHKEDKSPLTRADIAAHELITAALTQLTPALPILSEESADVPWDIRQTWSRYWLVDPLDGTREFIAGNGEFTVNIALVDAGIPVLGAVYAPVHDLLYTGARGCGAWKEEQGGGKAPIETAPVIDGQAHLRLIASRRHGAPEHADWIARLQQRFPLLELVNMGSSLKICLIAEGHADLYPRFAPTSEWDTAAAQAVLEAAGGLLSDTDFIPLRYNRKESLRNPRFIALGDPGFRP